MVRDIKDIPEEALMKVTKVREIAQCRFIGRDEYKRLPSGSPDVIVISVGNKRRQITRKQLISEYSDVKGKRIKLRTWKSDKKHLIMCAANTEMRAMFISNKMRNKFSINSDECLSDVYVVFSIMENGEVDFSSPEVYDKKMFHKSFRVEELSSMVKCTVSSKRSTKTKTNEEKKVYEEAVADEDCADNIEISKENKHTEEKTTYHITARIVNDTDGSLVGFLITERTGSVKAVKSNELMNLVRLSKVDNACIVDNGNKKFLRGVGIRLSELPEKRVRCS